jgi:hypothetical protein
LAVLVLLHRLAVAVGATDLVAAPVLAGDDVAIVSVAVDLSHKRNIGACALGLDAILESSIAVIRLELVGHPVDGDASEDGDTKDTNRGRSWCIHTPRKGGR